MSRYRYECDDCGSECLVEGEEIDSCPICEWHRPDEVLKLRARVAELEAENERLRLDAARIDWLGDRDNHIGNVQLPTRCIEENISNFRGAIDMAMGLNS